MLIGLFREQNSNFSRRPSPICPATAISFSQEASADISSCQPQLVIGKTWVIFDTRCVHMQETAAGNEGWTGPFLLNDTSILSISLFSSSSNWNRLRRIEFFSKSLADSNTEISLYWKASMTLKGNYPQSKNLVDVFFPFTLSLFTSCQTELTTG